MQLLFSLHVTLELSLLVSKQILVLVEFLVVEILKFTNFTYIFLNLELMILVKFGQFTCTKLIVTHLPSYCLVI